MDRRRVSSGTDPILSSVEEGVHATSSGTHRMLSGVVRDSACVGCLRSAVIARHSNECIIPMEDRYENGIPNLMRSASSDNTAIFVRPVNIIRTGGSVGLLRSGRRRRVREVLFRLSTGTNRFTSDVVRDCGGLTRLGLVFTGTSLTCSVGTSGPVVGSEKVVRLGRTHRPLVSGGGIIPISIVLKGRFSALMVANPGANNGAMALGAVNLLALVTVYKLLIPYTSGDRLSIFEEILISVNSRRDVRRSLSAFSKRVAGVIRVVGLTGTNSLYLVSRLNTKASPIRNTTLTVTVLRGLHSGRTGVTSAARCTRLGRFTLHAPKIRGNDYRFSITALGPACQLLVNIPNGDGTFTVSGELKVSSRVVDQTDRLISGRGERFRSIIRGLRGHHRDLRGRLRGTGELATGTGARGRGTRGRVRGTGRHTRHRVRGTERRTRHVVSHAETRTSTITRRLRGTEGTGSVDIRTEARLGGGVSGVRTRTSPIGTHGAPSRRCGLPEPLGINSAILVCSVSGGTAMLTPPGGSNIILIRTNVVGAEISVGGLHLLGSGGGPTGSEFSDAEGIPDEVSIHPRARISIHNRATFSTVGVISGTVSGTILSNIDGVAVVRNGNANILGHRVGGCLGAGGSIGDRQLNIFNRKRSNIAVVRLGWGPARFVL